MTISTFGKRLSRKALCSRKCKRIPRVRFVLASLLAFVLLLSSCKTNRPTVPEGSAHVRMNSPNPLPVLIDHGVTYTKVRDEVFDRKHMTKIFVALILQSGVTKPNVEALLRKYYREAEARRGFHFRPRASDIEVTAYASPEHASSEMGQWLAMLHKYPEDSTPQLQFDDVQFAQIAVAPVERFELSDTQRRIVFRKLMQDAHPDMRPVTDVKQTVDSLVQVHQLVQADLDSIAAEGQRKHWAYPPMDENR